MIMNYRKHSKRIKTASVLTLIMIGLIFFIVTACSKEEGKKQDDTITSPATDISNTPPLKVDENNIIIVIQKEGEIWVEGEKIDLTSILNRIEKFRNEHPEGNVIITCDKDNKNNMGVKEVLEQIRAAKIKSVVVAASKEE